MSNNISNALEYKKWAVVGATENKAKFGYKVYKKLKNHGYSVFPVNPGHDEIEGNKCYKSITDIPNKIEVVSLIVNPKIGVSTISEAAEKDVKIIWCQPGAVNEDIIEEAEKQGIELIYNECVLVELG